MVSKLQSVDDARMEEMVDPEVNKENIFYVTVQW